MCKSVISIIKSCIKDYKNIDNEDEINNMFLELQKNGHISYEAWG